MSLCGVNKLCAQCIQECKQWQQVRVINCPFFKSRQQQSAKAKNGATLQAQQNLKAARREAIFERKGNTIPTYIYLQDTAGEKL